jgi:hypothetical protein
MRPHRCCALTKERRDINVVPTYACSQLNPVSPIAYSRREELRNRKEYWPINLLRVNLGTPMLRVPKLFWEIIATCDLKVYYISFFLAIECWMTTVPSWNVKQNHFFYQRSLGFIRHCRINSGLWLSMSSKIAVRACLLQHKSTLEVSGPSAVK